MPKQTITVKTNDENPEPVELIADSIIKVSEAFDKLNKLPLKRRAVVLLLQDIIGTTHITKKQIELILDYAPKLKEYYVKETTKKK